MCAVSDESHRTSEHVSAFLGYRRTAEVVGEDAVDLDRADVAMRTLRAHHAALVGERAGAVAAGVDRRTAAAGPDRLREPTVVAQGAEQWVARNQVRARTAGGTTALHDAGCDRRRRVAIDDLGAARTCRVAPQDDVGQNRAAAAEYGVVIHRAAG